VSEVFAGRTLLQPNSRITTYIMPYREGHMALSLQHADMHREEEVTSAFTTARNTRLGMVFANYSRTLRQRLSVPNILVAVPVAEGGTGIIAAEEMSDVSYTGS
jgi:hypothetical protein